jgi:uncharacterized protein
MPRFVRHPSARFLLLYLPILAVIVFQCVIRFSSRDIRLTAYEVFFNEFFLLSVPYAVTALVFVVAAIRARKWIAATGALFAFTLGVSAVYGRFVEPERIVISESSLQVGAPLRVALISDLHIGLFQGRERTAQIVTTLNALDVDVVLVAGDWTYEPTMPLRELLAPLVASRHRILSVPGNHDEEMPGPPLAAELRAALVEHGVEPIEGQVITVKGVRFVGIGDRWARKDFVPTLADQSTPLVALTHNPDSVDRLRDTPIRTLLAGHTHGGQINLPIITDWVLQSATRQGFKKGLYQRGAQQVFVTSGLGMVGLPLRLFQPPVIDVITFR